MELDISFMDLIHHALEVFEDPQKTLRWFHSYAESMGCHPIDIVNTSEGRLQINQILGRIEYGIF
jgi:uncharacterized protein (DUF2384 family)